MKNKLFLLLLLLLIPLLCFSGTVIYNYKIHYAGLPVAFVTMTEESTDSLVTITLESTSKGLASGLFPIENTYVSFCDRNYIPYHYWKTIYQQNVHEKKIVVFDQNEGIVCVRDVMDQEVDTLTCKFPVYDIISMTFSLLSDFPENKKYTCHGNYRIWELIAQRGDAVDLTFQNKTYECHKYTINSEIEYDSEIESKTDILTNNIFKKGGKTVYWVTKDEPHLLLKAKYKRFPFSIYLILTNIKTE